MNDSEYKNLVEKYKEGTSSLEEENRLFGERYNADPSFEAWSTFVKKNKTESSNDFNDNLWKSFQDKKAIKLRRWIGIITAVASVLFVLSFYFGYKTQNVQSYAEKERLLHQALNMFESIEQQEIKYHVFYENDMIVVHTVHE